MSTAEGYFLIRSRMASTQDAFVILPFEDEFEDLYHDKIVPTLEEHDYSVNKADSLAAQRNIIEDIINGITNADLIIADLTGTNPNVFYELGIAHGVGIPTVLIAQDIEELPFDLSAYKTIEYSLRYDKIKMFEEELSNICSNHNEGEIEFGSPVSDYTNVNIDRNKNQEKVTDSSSDASENTGSHVSDGPYPKTDPVEETKTEAEIISYMTKIDKQKSDIHDYLDEVIEESKHTNTKLQSHVDRLNGIITIDSPAHRKEINNVSREIANNLHEYLIFIEDLEDKLKFQLNLFMDSTQDVIENADVSKESERDVLIELQEVLTELIQHIKRSIDEIEEFKSNIEKTRGTNKKLDDSLNTLNNILEPFQNILDEGLAKGVRFESLIDNKIHNS